MRNNNFYNRISQLFLLIAFFSFSSYGQSYTLDAKRQSARSDKRTGGTIEKAALAPGAGNLKITLNVPSFLMTLWQDGKEVKTYRVGVGMKDYPIYVGMREASSVIWNPVWIPPASDWVEGSKTVKAGDVILPTDPRNPLGRIKIPLGLGYLIHQAKGTQDLGNLVSHGCVRVLENDLDDLTKKIVAARALPVTNEQIAAAKTNKKTLEAEIAPPIPVEITYDTMVVEAKRLHIYPDVYARGKNTVENLRAELASDNVDTKRLSDATLKKMLASAVSKKQFVVSLASLEKGTVLRDGRAISVLNVPAAQSKIVSRKSRATRKK